jgi:hypothetical protein
VMGGDGFFGLILIITPHVGFMAKMPPLPITHHAYQQKETYGRSNR